MCGRFVISEDNILGISYRKNFNIAPSSNIPVKTSKASLLMRWSYGPSWKADMDLINCRSETIHEKPSFKIAERCLIPFNGWYEWQRSGNQKTPYFFHQASALYFAGLYNTRGCLILTRKSISAIEHIHHRQPVLLFESDAILFLKGEDIFDSHANQDILFHRVSSSVNNPRNNLASLIEQI